jgi:hypothetical protein
MNPTGERTEQERQRRHFNPRHLLASDGQRLTARFKDLTPRLNPKGYPA